MPEAPRNDGRRGPSKETVDAVLPAAFHLLVTEGIGALTPTRLFQTTGVARTTIYRHWPDPAAFVADLIAGATRRDDLDRYVGELEADLRTALATLTFRLANRPVGPFLAALLSADVGLPADRRLVPGYVTGLLAPLTDVLDQARSRGDLGPEAATLTSVELAAELAGPLLTRAVLLDDPVGEDELERAVLAFLDRHRLDRNGLDR